MKIGHLLVYIGAAWLILDNVPAGTASFIDSLQAQSVKVQASLQGSFSAGWYLVGAGIGYNLWEKRSIW